MTARMMTHKLSVRRPLAKLIDKDEILVMLPENNVYADIGTLDLFIKAAQKPTCNGAALYRCTFELQFRLCPVSVTHATVP